MSDSIRRPWAQNGLALAVVVGYGLTLVRIPPGRLQRRQHILFFICLCLSPQSSYFFLKRVFSWQIFSRTRKCELIFFVGPCGLRCYNSTRWLGFTHKFFEVVGPFDT